MASIYIHIPFCEHKCIYCDFYSIAPSNPNRGFGGLQDKFLDSLETEIRIRSGDSRPGQTAETIYFGGGTPSILDPSEIEKILKLIALRFDITAKTEITIETNPGTVNRAKLTGFRAAGINRISLGVQSFHDEDLKFLTRIHTASDAERCAEDIRRAGFDNMSFDLIFSLPGQSMHAWRSNLEQAVNLEPEHISCYSLTIEPETPLFRMVRAGDVTPCSSDQEAEIYDFTIDFLAGHDYSQYEISNFARGGRKCMHNISYWNHSPYLGFGPSAHSFLENERWWNTSDVEAYVEKLERKILPLSGGEHLTGKQLAEEAVFLGLRSEGIDLLNFPMRYNLDLSAEHKDNISGLIQEGYAFIDNGRLRLTKKGYVICDEICQSFY